MANKKKQSTWAVVLIIVLTIAALYVKGQEDKKRESVGTNGSEVDTTGEKEVKPSLKAVSSSSKKLAELTGAKTQNTNSELPVSVTRSLTKVKFENKKFEVLEGCSLVDHRHNDGDSFHVKHGDKETEFRLYFVDTAESQYKEYRDGNNNGQRLREQGAYFGGLEMQVTTEVGKVAKSFVRDLLKKKKFTVVTKWEDVFTPERKYCYVIVEWQGEDVYLHELLLVKGLVRLKTRGATLPDNTNYFEQKKKLEQLEKKAKAAKVGAWGM